jgi:hypothetical protein
LQRNAVPHAWQSGIDSDQKKAKCVNKNDIIYGVIHHSSQLREPLMVCGALRLPYHHQFNLNINGVIFGQKFEAQQNLKGSGVSVMGCLHSVV